MVWLTPQPVPLLKLECFQEKAREAECSGLPNAVTVLTAFSDPTKLSSRKLAHVPLRAFRSDSFFPPQKCASAAGPNEGNLSYRSLVRVDLSDNKQLFPVCRGQPPRWGRGPPRKGVISPPPPTFGQFSVLEEAYIEGSF